MADENGGMSIGWFIAGLGIGGLLGVLYAPKTGRETREDLLTGAAQAKDKAAQLAAEGREQISGYVNQGKEALGEYADKGQQYVDKGKEFIDKGKTQWSQYVDRGRGFVNEQQDKVGAAVEAGKQAYQSTTSGADEAL